MDSSIDSSVALSGSSESLSINSDVLNSSMSNSSMSEDDELSSCDNDSEIDSHVSVEADAGCFDGTSDQPLYDGASFSVFESYLMILKYSLCHRLTKQATSDLLGLIGSLLPQSLVSLHKFKKFFLDVYKDIAFQTQYCCSHCHCPLKEANSNCPNSCDGSAVEFLSISVDAQLKRKLEGTFIVCSYYKLHIYF